MCKANTDMKCIMSYDPTQSTVFQIKILILEYLRQSETQGRVWCVASVLHSVGCGEMHCYKEVFVYSPEYLFFVTLETRFLNPAENLTLSFLF